MRYQTTTAKLSDSFACRKVSISRSVFSLDLSGLSWLANDPSECKPFVKALEFYTVTSSGRFPRCNDLQAARHSVICRAHQPDQGCALWEWTHVLIARCFCQVRTSVVFVLYVCSRPGPGPSACPCQIWHTTACHRHIGETTWSYNVNFVFVRFYLRCGVCAKPVPQFIVNILMSIRKAACPIR